MMIGYVQSEVGMESRRSLPDLGYHLLDRPISQDSSLQYQDVQVTGDTELPSRDRLRVILRTSPFLHESQGVRR